MRIVEWIIIVIGVSLLVVPEILYSLILRGRDWLANRILELYINYIKKGVKL